MAYLLPQLIVNGLIAGSIYALAAAGFALVYYVVKFQYFSHGATMAVAAYSFFAFVNLLHLNYVMAAMLTIILSILFTLLKNLLVYRQLRKRKATPTISLITSVVVLIFTSSLLLAVFGSSTKRISFYNRTFDFGIVTITLIQVSIIFSALLLFLLLGVIFKKTKLGKAMRASADNTEVAQVVGINPERIYFYTFIISAVFGAVGGILLGLEQNLYPRMGIPIIIKGFIGSVVGGLGSVPGSIIGGLFIGLAENIGVLYLPTGYKDLISFSVLLLFLLLRPQGILGVKMRDT